MELFCIQLFWKERRKLLLLIPKNLLLEKKPAKIWVTGDKIQPVDIVFKISQLYHTSQDFPKDIKKLTFVWKMLQNSNLKNLLSSIETPVASLIQQINFKRKWCVFCLKQIIMEIKNLWTLEVFFLFDFHPFFLELHPNLCLKVFFVCFAIYIWSTQNVFGFLWKINDCLWKIFDGWNQISDFFNEPFQPRYNFPPQREGEKKEKVWLKKQLIFLFWFRWSQKKHTRRQSKTSRWETTWLKFFSLRWCVDAWYVCFFLEMIGLRVKIDFFFSFMRWCPCKFSTFPVARCAFFFFWNGWK